MPGGGVYYRGRFHLLYVKIDSIALLRQWRGGKDPDPAEAAAQCEEGGCDGITVHLSENGGYIGDRDISAIKDRVRGKLNLEIALSDNTMEIAKKARPDKVIVAPKKGGAFSTEGGLDRKTDLLKMKDAVQFFHDQNIQVSLCIEPEAEAIALAKEIGTDFIEIHAGAYCNALQHLDMDREIQKIYTAANHAVKAGVKVGAGHGLHYSNIAPVLKARALEEVHIGHSIVSRSIFVGLSQAVAEMLEVLE